LPWCINNFESINKIFYSKGGVPIVDMASMALCEHNIIANSGFSAWGAILNNNLEKIVICPLRYLRNDNIISYVNYSWYPDAWIGLGTGNN